MKKTLSTQFCTGFSMSPLLPALEYEFRRHQALADKAIAQFEGNLFFARPAPHVNSAAVIVKHLSGNMRSRWMNFLTSDGEKPDRHRDAEFAVGTETRAELLADWDRGWAALYETFGRTNGSGPGPDGAHSQRAAHRSAGLAARLESHDVSRWTDFVSGTACESRRRMAHDPAGQE